MKILFISRIPFRGVSGGRYLSALFAERLARNGHQVTFWVNYKNPLIFPKEVILRTRIRRLFPILIGRYKYLDLFYFNIHRYILSYIFKKTYDHVIIVPEEDRFELHKFFSDIAESMGKRVHLLNFETPNWFNTSAPIKRDPERWNGWCHIANRSKSVISISETSHLYAKKFYGEDLNYQWHNFPVYQESDLRPTDWEKRDNAAVCISRMDPHKGVDGLVEFIGVTENLVTFHLVIGSMKLDEHFVAKLSAAAVQNSVKLIIHKKISHEEKFTLLGSVKYLIFPTYFEGLGMPPIEALASGCKVAAFDLPVLREISCYIEVATPGDFTELASIVDKGMNSPSTILSKQSVEKHEVNSLANMNGKIL